MADIPMVPEHEVPHVEVDELARRVADGAVVLDVREPDEYHEAHVPGAVLVPLGELAERLDDVPDARPLHVVCAAGARSLRAAQVLRARGVDAVNVAGGTNLWRALGYDVATGSAPA